MTATGTLGAVVSVDVGSQVSGKITHLYVDFNSPVHKGQLVAQIDPSVYQAQLQQALGELASARADATLKGDYQRVVLGIAVMCGFVIATNRILWRPLYEYAGRRLRFD